MPSDRKAISRLLMLTLFVSAAGLFIIYSFLPDILEYSARQIVLRKTPFSQFNSSVLHAGLNGIEIDDIAAGNPQNPALSIGSVNIRYSAAGLFRKRIKTIDIQGLALFLTIDDGEINIPGLNISARNKEEQTVSPGISMPVDLHELQIKNGNLHITDDGKRHVIPFDLVLKQKIPGQPSYYKAVLQIYPFSEKVTVSAEINFAANSGRLKLTAKSLSLEKFVDLTGGFAGMDLNGLAAVDAVSEITLQPLEVISAEAEIALQPFYLRFNDIQIGVQKNELPGKPLQLSIAYKEKNLQYRIDGMSLTKPIKVTSSLAGVLSFSDEKMSGSGDFSLAVIQIPSLEMIDPVQVNGAAAYGYDLLTEDWYFDITQGPAAGRQNIRLQYKDVLIESDAQDFFVSGKGLGSKGLISFSAAYPNITVSQNDLRGKAGLSLTGDAVIQSGSEKNGGETIQAAGRLKIQKGEVQLKNSALAVQSIKADIPWQFPASQQEKTGSFTASDIKWQKAPLGSFSSDITLQNTTYSLNGNYTSSLLQGLVLGISGQAGLTDGGLAANLEMHTEKASFSSGKLGMINPSLAKAFLKGKLELAGSLKYEGNRLQGEMQGELQDGRLEFTEKKYVIEDIALSGKLPFLPQIKTGPAQQLRFAKASLGNLYFTDGRVSWQLESVDSLFIESSVFNWVGGNLQVNEARFMPDKKPILITILCERLNLIEILKQFGVENAEGEGTVSGEIPLLLGKKAIDFKDGFLASSPGEGGRIRIAALDMLSAGIPKNTPQFAQVDFAAEALKNFRYDRVKLLLNSEGEDLIMQMQMDGKPLQSLPFIYDSQTGELKRADDTKQGINQPIRLDVNFRLPLNRFLGYSGKIQEIMKKIK